MPLAACVCVLKKKRQQRGRGGDKHWRVPWKIIALRLACWDPSVLCVYWYGWRWVVGKGQSLLSRSPFCSRAGHFYVAYAPFLLFVLSNEAVRASGRHWQTVSMATRAHPSWLHQPHLLGCHGTLQRLGRRWAFAVCLCPELQHGAKREHGAPSSTLVVENLASLRASLNIKQ